MAAARDRAIMCFDFDGTVLNNPNGAFTANVMSNFAVRWWRPTQDLTLNDVRVNHGYEVSIWIFLIMVQCAILDVDVAMCTGHTEAGWALKNVEVVTLFRSLYARANHVARRLAPSAVPADRSDVLPDDKLCIVKGSKADAAAQLSKGYAWAGAIDDTTTRRDQFMEGFVRSTRSCAASTTLVSPALATSRT